MSQYLQKWLNNAKLRVPNPYADCCFRIWLNQIAVTYGYRRDHRPSASGPILDLAWAVSSASKIILVVSLLFTLNWATSWENLFFICEQQRRRSECASAQSDQRLCCSLPRYRKTGNFRVVQFSRNFAVSMNPRKLKSARYFHIFEKLVLRN